MYLCIQFLKWFKFEHSQNLPNSDKSGQADDNY